MEAMVFNLMLAEVQKVVGNRMLTGFTLWVYPIGATAFIVTMIIFATIAPLPSEDVIDIQPWAESMTGVWLIVTAFPGSIFMRLLVIAFFTAFIAGEYDWHTWKNIVPLRRRGTLLANRLVTLSGLLVFSLALTSLIWALGWGMFAYAFDQTYGPPVSGEVLGDFLPSYLFEAAIMFGTALLLAGISALAALLTRSLVGGLLLAFGLSIAEAISGLFLTWLAFIFGKPAIAGLFAFTPTYSIDNMRAWFRYGSALPLNDIPGFASEPVFGVSLLIFVLWIIALMILSIWIFQRQDLVS